MAEKIIDIVKLKKSPHGTLGNIELYSGEPIIVKNGSKYELYVGTEASANKSTSKYNLSTLVNLTDTSIVSPTYEHSLVFDATINKWVNGYPDGFKKYTTLPLVFSGTQIIYDSSVWTWSGTSYVNNSDTLDGKHASAFSSSDHTHDDYLPLDGGVMSGILDMDGNVFKNAGFEEFPVLPTTFKGSQITYINKVWTWDNVNSKYIPDNATPIIPIITIDVTERDKTIVHNLGYRPDIVVMDDTGEIVYVTKKHLDNNRLYLSWLGGFIGNIILK